MKSSTRCSAVVQAAAAGLLAGALVGLGEVFLLVLLTGNATNFQGLLWAVLAYSLLGLLAGLGLGIVVVLLPRQYKDATVFSFALALIFAGMGLFITRYRLYRDLFHEGIRTVSLQGLLFNGGLILLFAGLFALLLWLGGRSWPRSANRLLLGAGGLCLLVVVAAVVSLLARPESQLAQAPGGVPPGLEDAPNVILIGADTLRADRLSCYGYSDSQTPNVDALATDGVLYSEMMAQASWTKPSFATIFTSLYPSSHTATGKPHRLPDAVITLAEVLAAGGYHTGGYANNPSIGPAFGFDQGFADYVYLPPAYLFAGNEAASQTALYQIARRVWAMVAGGRVYPQHFYQEASVINRHALEWLEANGDTRFLLFLHYMDPHDPYFVHPFNGVGYARASNQNPDPTLAPTFSRLYDEEVRYLDRHLGELIDWLKARDLYDNTVIVLTGDHGEEFQEHGGWWHGQTLYQEQVAVPLIVKYPQSTDAGSIYNGLVRSLDIAPTILDLAGVPVPEAMMGRSLLGGTEPPAFAYAEEDHEGNVLQALRSASHKLILANADNPRGLPAEELFDLVADPGEQQDLFAAELDLGQDLQESLRQVLAFALERAVEGVGASLEAGMQEQLRNLGY